MNPIEAHRRWQEADPFNRGFIIFVLALLSTGVCSTATAVGGALEGLTTQPPTQRTQTTAEHATFGTAVTPEVAAAILEQVMSEPPLTPTPPPTPTPWPTGEAAPLGAPHTLTHTIQPGETLYSLVPQLITQGGIRLPVSVRVGGTSVTLSDLTHGSRMQLPSAYRAGEVLTITTQARGSGPFGEVRDQAHRSTESSVEGKWVMVEMLPYEGARHTVVKRLFREQFADGTVRYSYGSGSGLFGMSPREFDANLLQIRVISD